MRVLFISNTFPTDLRTKVHGVYKRMSLFIDAIKPIAAIDFLFYVSHSTDTSPHIVSKLEQDFKEYWQADLTLTLCQRSNKQHRFLRRPNYLPGALSFLAQPPFIGISGKAQINALEGCLAKQPDAVFAHRLQAMCPLLQTSANLPPIFFDLDDIEHISLARQINLPAQYRKKPLAQRLYLPSLKRGELRAIRKAHKTFICSDHDQRYLAQQLGLPGIVTIPNAIKIPPPQPLAAEPTLLFIGSYTYQPNVSAAEFLIAQVWPYIQSVVPGAQLIIAGAHPENIPAYAGAHISVKFTGFVDDLDELYNSTGVVCCPILSGGGTRVKIIEAAAYRKPIVSTRIGAEGLDLIDGEAILVRDSPKAFAEACIELLQNPKQCQQMGLAAYGVIAKRYDRKHVVQQIQQHLQL
jgi:glycosyltransferase involved in cell wall biosynthesis